KKKKNPAQTSCLFFSNRFAHEINCFSHHRQFIPFTSFNLTATRHKGVIATLSHFAYSSRLRSFVKVKTVVQGAVGIGVKACCSKFLD
ncbi:TPA: hypothetical protein ACKFLE_002622, partial [Enterococcus faecium]|uniref:hypothetical protein n=4 Tax=Enterococcus faecium TaxID=1352 RepID=UPI00298F1068